MAQYTFGVEIELRPLFTAVEKEFGNEGVDMLIAILILSQHIDLERIMRALTPLARGQAIGPGVRRFLSEFGRVTEHLQ